MNLFIDTNIYLAFYHYTSDDLEQLKKLAEALDNKEIRLIITRQVIDEFYRNREAKIADSLKSVKDQKPSDKFPGIFREYEEFEFLKKALNEYKEYKKQIMVKLMKDIADKNLKADLIIKNLFDKAEHMETDKEILLAAKNRMDIGNPPGKKGSYGDAINWETLIMRASNNDLYFIARDKDYDSPMEGKNLMNDFLMVEWNEKKKSDIHYYNELSTFFKNEYPKIELTVEADTAPAYASTFDLDGRMEIADTPPVYEGTFTYQYLDLNNNGKLDPGEPYWIINPPQTNSDIIPPAGVMSKMD